MLKNIEGWLERHSTHLQSILAIFAIAGIMWGGFVFIPNKIKEWRYPDGIYIQLFGFYGNKPPWEMPLNRNQNEIELPFELKKDEAFTVDLKLIQRNSDLPYFNYIHLFFPEKTVKITPIADKYGWVWLQANDIRENVYYLDCTNHRLVNDVHNILSFNITPLREDLLDKGIACSYRITYQVANKRNTVTRQFTLYPKGARGAKTYRHLHKEGDTYYPVSGDQTLTPASPPSVTLKNN